MSPASALPAITFGQLKLLASAGAPLHATIRSLPGGYRIEIGIGPRRWLLVSTHRKCDRLFQHLDGAANAARRLGARSVVLELGASPCK